MYTRLRGVIKKSVGMTSEMGLNSFIVEYRYISNKNPPFRGEFYFFQNANPRRADLSSRCLRSSIARRRSARRSWKRRADSSSR